MAAPDGRDARLALLASRQGGAFSFRQALDQGFPRATISRRLARGTWERRLPGVFVVGGAERTSVQDLWVAVLAVGPAATITHETACVLSGAERLPIDPITLTNPHSWHHDLPGIFVHQIDDLQPWHRTTWRGLPVSTPARAAVELAATQPASVIGRVIDDLVAAKRTTLDAVQRVFLEVARPGKPGMVQLGRVLEARGDGYVPPASELEHLLFTVLDAGGLPAPQRQVRLIGRAAVIGTVDAAYPEAKLIIEVDGRRWHDRVAASAEDRRRDAEAARTGWQTLRFDFALLRRDPAQVCEIVRDTLRLRVELLRRPAA